MGGGKWSVMSWNETLQEVWVRCKECPTLQCFVIEVGDIDEHAVVSWQRMFAVGTWERTYCDFLWACSQCKRGSSEWVGIMQQLWPQVCAIAEEKKMECLFNDLHLT